MQHIILKFVLFISSVLSVNATLSLPLSSIINSDTQQVEYVEYKQATLSLKLKKTPNQILLHKRSTSKACKSYLCKNRFLDSFNLYEDSLSLIVTLNTQQQYKKQKTILLNIPTRQLHQPHHQTFYQAESKSSTYKNFC
ncbi:MAG: hypothetical protein HRT52_17400 [Colwellia sp.]|nr:hypothetical protein [Colwellia sp.]